MTLFGISETNIIETGDREDMTIDSRGTDDHVSLSSNWTIPNLTMSGIESVYIFKKGENRYLVECWGGMTGNYVVTREGIEELGTTLLSNQEPIPSWTIYSRPDELPDWVPSDYHPPDPVECDKCGTEVAVTTILTPMTAEKYEKYCPDCWNDSL